MQFGVIGFGAWGGLHAKAMEGIEGIDLVAIGCGDAASAEAASAAHPYATIYRDWRQLLSDSKVEAVSVVVPNHLHAEVGIAALEAGKDVLMEKPMANTLEDCDRLIAAAARSGAVLSVGHQLRVSLQWGAIKTALERDELGAPRYANVSLFRFPFRPGVGGWRYDRNQVGSWMLEEAVHFFDLLVWFFEKWGAPISVRAVANGRAEHAGLQQNVTVWVRFDNEVYATVTQSLGGFENHSVLEMVGEAGSLRSWWSGITDRTDAPQFELKVQRAGTDMAERIPLSTSGEVFELEEQLRCTAEAFRMRRTVMSGAQARQAVAICLAAERSLREGNEIALAP